MTIDTIVSASRDADRIREYSWITELYIAYCHDTGHQIELEQYIQKIYVPNNYGVVFHERDNKTRMKYG